MLAQTTTSANTSVYFIWFVVWYVLICIPLYVIFKKAGRDDAWAAFIPIYSFYVLLKVVGRPGWWLILLLIPIVDFIILIMVYNDLSKSFGHGVGFTLGLIFLSVIFYLILAFGSSQYRGPAAGGGVTPPAPPMPTA
jgi:Family of unknown function (DUF5684)